MKEINITLLIQKYIKRYTEMDINGILINCPYWANKIKESKVIARGFQDGKSEKRKGNVVNPRNSSLQVLHHQKKVKNVFIKRQIFSKQGKLEQFIPVHSCGQDKRPAYCQKR